MIPVLEKLSYNFLIAVEAVLHNKLRSLLTSLGIIFGVASVIAMLAIGQGAKQEILDQIRLLGANNVIVTPIVKQEEGAMPDEDAEKTEKQPFSPGLTLADAASIATLVPGVVSVSPEVVMQTSALRAGLRRSVKLVGVDAPYFENGDFELAEGSYFTPVHYQGAMPVCIIGWDVKTRFFARDRAIGNRIKAGNLWLTVVGVLKERNLSTRHIERLGLRNYDLDIYTPIHAMLWRVKDRARLTRQDLRDGEQNRRRGLNKPRTSYHQIDRLVVRTSASSMAAPVAEVVRRMLQRRHYGVVDVEVIVPELLLKQERRTQAIFNIVLASIASISLLVGGIGIMNIMLASVMERIREIGVRRAVGATRHDVVRQFLIEAVTLSFTGGVAGIMLGILISIVIERTSGIATYVTVGSIALSFLVSVSVGVVFGLLPAKRAAEQDPVVSLRHE
ncbi:ABC transporter permease [Rhodocaloribacter sp.]